MYLQEGRMHYYDARPLVMASKTLNLLNDVLHQNDVRDYADKLMDRLEEALAQQDSSRKEAERSGKRVEEVSNSNSSEYVQEKKDLGKLQSMFTRRFKGIWATETHRLGDNIPEEHAVSSRTEPFFALAATIKNHSGGVGGKQPFFTNLEESLVDSVKGERMEGENQLNCDFLPVGDDGKTVKCNGVRRMFIEKLPEVLLIHLKRFEYDVSTYNIAKVKQKFEFPMSLNMFRYTRAGVAAATEKEAKEEQEDENEDSAEKHGETTEDKDTGGESKGKSDDNTPGPKGEHAGSGEPSADNSAAQDAATIASDPAFDYELVGVIVHNGASEQSGHYYSYALVPSSAKDKAKEAAVKGSAAVGGAELPRCDHESGKWFKFNDKTVTPFNPSSGAESEWFGGKSLVPVINQYTGEPVGNSTRMEFRNNSAYMLVYRRKASVNPNAVSETNEGVTSEALKMSARPSMAPSGAGQDAPQTHGERMQLLAQIWHENDLAIRTRWLFDPEFFSFMRDILVMAASLSTDEIGKNERDANKTASVINVAVEFFINVVIKGKDKSDLNRWVEVIASLLVSSPAAAVHILESASSQTYVQEKIIRQSLPELRGVFSDLCLSAVQALVPAFDSIEDQAESEMKADCTTSPLSRGVSPREKLNPQAQALLDLMIDDPEDVPSSIVAGVSYDGNVSTITGLKSEVEAVHKQCEESKKSGVDKDGLSASLSTVVESDPPSILAASRFVRILYKELQCHVNLVKESNWRRFGEFFRLVRGCTKLRTIRAYMVRIGFQNVLLGFYAGVLKGMQPWSVTIKNPQYGTADFEHLLGATLNLCGDPDALSFLNMPMMLLGERTDFVTQGLPKLGGGGKVTKPEDTVLGKLFLQHKNYHTVHRMIEAYAGGSRAFFTAVHRRLMEKLSDSIYTAEILRALEVGVTKLAISQEYSLLHSIDGSHSAEEAGQDIRDEIESKTTLVNSALDQLLFAVEYGMITRIQEKLAVIQSNAIGASPSAAYNMIQTLVKAVDGCPSLLDRLKSCLDTCGKVSTDANRAAQPYSFPLASFGDVTIRQILQNACIWLDSALYTYALQGKGPKSDYRAPSRVKILKRLARISGQKLVEQTLGGPSVDAASGDTVYGWYPEIKQDNENWFAARTIVYATPATSPGLVTEVRLRIGRLKKVDRQESGTIGFGVFQEVSDIVGEELNVKNQTEDATKAVDESVESMPPPSFAPANLEDRLPIGTRVKCVYNSMMYESIEQAREVKKAQMITHAYTQHQGVKYEELFGVVGGVSDQKGEGDVIYRIIYDKGEVDPFVRACFVEKCQVGDPPAPKSRFALKLLASRDIKVRADEPNMVDIQTFTLENPMLLPKGCFVGVYQKTFPPRIQYQSVWPRGEPFKYGVYIGLPNGAHPNEVGDVVHRCTKSEECPGLSISVKHFDDMESLEISRAQVTADNLRILEEQRTLAAERDLQAADATTASQKRSGDTSVLDEKGNFVPSGGWGIPSTDEYPLDNRTRTHRILENSDDMAVSVSNTGGQSIAGPTVNWPDLAEDGGEEKTGVSDHSIVVTFENGDSLV
jgi:hypothetical protein